MYARLGSVDTGRAAYLAWSATVKRYGGRIAALPHGDPNTPAAAYPFEVLYPSPLFTLNPIFTNAPEDWNADSSIGYYRAPDDVIAYARNGMLEAQSVPGEPVPAKPQWYDDLLKMLQAGKWVIGGLVALAAISYLPKRR